MENPDELSLFSLKPDIVSWYENWYGLQRRNRLQICQTVPFAIPMITWQPYSIPLGEIAAGKHDEYIIDYLTSITEQAPELNILIRFAHEMEMRPKYKIPWYSWQAERKPELYIAAWRHIVDLGHSINPRIKWIWSPNKIDEYADLYYPGDDYVDYLGVTMNLRETNKNYSNYRNFEEYYINEGVKEHIEKYDKKVIICEAAFSGDDLDAKQNFIRTTFDYLLQDPNLAGVIFFNKDKLDDDGITPKLYNQFQFSNEDVCVEEFNNGLIRVRDYRIANGID